MMLFSTYGTNRYVVLPNYMSEMAANHYSKLMLNSILNLFRSRLLLPQLPLDFCIFVYKKYKKTRNEEIKIDFEMFKRGQFKLKLSSKPENLGLSTMQILYISTKKDFNTLCKSLESSKKVLQNFNVLEIVVYVPKDQVGDCQILLSSFFPEVIVRSENTLVSMEEFTLLKEHFQSRAGWVLQQILKVAGVLYSDAEYSLVVDSDTILLRERNWIPNGKSGVLTPSDEFNPDYYIFLEKLGITSANPFHSFVPHHMLIEKRFLMEALSKIDTLKISSLIDMCIKLTEPNSFSALCVDYELYAQYMFQNHPEKIVLEKWANLGVPVKFFDFFISHKLVENFLSKFYDSVSFHSWS